MFVCKTFKTIPKLFPKPKALLTRFLFVSEIHGKSCTQLFGTQCCEMFYLRKVFNTNVIYRIGSKSNIFLMTFKW